MATIQVKRRDGLSLAEKLYIPEVMRGMVVTTRQLVKNVFGHQDIATRQYPEVKKAYPERFRGRHRLTWRDDGSVRCVACMLCSTACPANCIHIVAGDRGDEKIEKYPVSFEIDLLVCVYCGMCVEACPCDAIRMDTGTHPMPSFSRDKQRIRKVQLLEEGLPSTARQGGLGT
ncbi:MAG: NADH-quinone oxidoreductase subunit I [Deltaproteobacteria bacterium HGW-Deltaproteobacteria-14]|jgi:NADH-quinone oxidoreductase subunit I|nr:MAG: NADH-quinone oxidoreductase subunit I [Deltaproteobacteria bacterium HGW-Deltaproteobacteria-14]